MLGLCVTPTHPTQRPTIAKEKAGGESSGREGKHTVVIWISPEELPERLGVLGRVARPHVPYLIAQWVLHERVLRVVGLDIVHADVRRLCVWIVRRIEGLGGEKAEMFAPEEAALILH